MLLDRAREDLQFYSLTWEVALLGTCLVPTLSHKYAYLCSDFLVYITGIDTVYHITHGYFQSIEEGALRTYSTVNRKRTTSCYVAPLWGNIEAKVTTKQNTSSSKNARSK